MIIAIPIVLVGLSVGAIVMLALGAGDRDVPNHEPDAPPPPPPPGFPRTTGYKLVDKILPQLKAASESSQIPLGLLVGWVAKESGGKLGELTRLDERGVFQLHPEESKALGLDHQRLSTDLVYSINAGLLLIGKYMKMVDGFDVAQKGSEFYWRLVKLAHTMGSGATKKIVAMAKTAGEAKSWTRLYDYALDHEKEIMRAVKHSPTKWLPFVNKIFATGAPFGVGNSDMIVGASFPDIVDPLDVLAKLPLA